MRKTTMSIGIVIIVMMSLLVQNVHSDIYMKTKTHNEPVTIMGQTQPAETVVNESWLTDDKMAVINKKQTIFTDFGKNIVTIANHEKKILMSMPMNFSDIADRKSADMSAEDKEGFKQMMGKMMQMDIKVTVTNEKKKIGKWNCRKYIQTMNMGVGKMTSEIWATKDIKMDLELYARFSAGMMAQMPGISQNMEKILKELKKIEGVHVLTKQSMDMMGQVIKTSTTLLDFKQAKAPAKVFKLPAYKKQDMFR